MEDWQQTKYGMTEYSKTSLFSDHFFLCALNTFSRQTTKLLASVAAVGRLKLDCTKTTDERHETLLKKQKTRYIYEDTEGNIDSWTKRALPSYLKPQANLIQIHT